MAGRKKLTKKAKLMLRWDILASVALVSVLLNVFFFSGVVLYSSTNQLDASLYEAAEQNLCLDNYTENLEDALRDADDPQAARAKFEIQCRSGQFEAYYQNAVDSYLNNTL